MSARAILASCRELFARRRLLLAGWALLAGAAVLMTVPLTVFLLDAQTPWTLVPHQEEMRRHSCLSAYVAGAALLGEEGAPLYDPAQYDRATPDSERAIPLGSFDQDAYQYPPPFLLLPRAFLALSGRFATLRVQWYVGMVLAILGGLGVLCAWIGGRRGLIAALLMPAFWVAEPNLLTLQVGNIQPIVVLAALLGMVALEIGRRPLGGLLLAFAVCTKIHPGILLLILLAERRWRDLAWTGAFIALLCLATLAIGGLEPFREFFLYQAPRLQSGEAVAFFKQSFGDSIINLSIYGLPHKFHHLGIGSNPDAVAPLLGAGFSLALIATALAFGWFTRAARTRQAADEGERAARAMLWLCLLDLAGIQSPFAPPYHQIGTLWLLILWTSGARSPVRAGILFAIGWAALTLLIETPPFLVVTGFTMQLAYLAINLGALFHVWRRWSGGAAGALRLAPLNDWYGS